MSLPPSSQLSVSLESHLVEALRPLCSILPATERSQLEQYLSNSSSISYSLLQSISQWTRSPEGTQALHSASPSLNPGDYTMVSLLAGATTSPGSKFPPYVPPKGEDEIAEEKKRERKAIGVIVNGVFSVIGTGAAAWWGSKNSGWKDEWRILFAFFAAVIVALAEVVLYIFWQQGLNAPPKKKRRWVRVKKVEDDDDQATGTSSSKEEVKEGMRLRNVKPGGQEE